MSESGRPSGEGREGAGTAPAGLGAGGPARGASGGADDHAPVRRAYGRLAAIYDRRWRRYVDATVRETLARIELTPGSAVLDVACGTGVLLGALRSEREPGRLVGVDLSIAMLEVARRRLGPGVDLAEASAEGLPFGDRTFDLVVSTNAFHYFRRPLAALGEMRRVLRPGGRLVLADWCDDYLACRVCDLVLRALDPSHFRTYGTKRCRRMLEAAALRVARLERYKITWLWGLMTAVAERRG